MQGLPLEDKKRRTGRHRPEADRWESKETWRERLDRALDRFFPERQIHLRTDGRVSFVRLTRQAQIYVVTALAVAGGWMAFSSISYALNERILATKDQQIDHARVAYRGLLTEVSEYQKKFSSISSELEENHALLLGLVEQNVNLQQSLKSAETELASTEGERKRIHTARISLQGKLSNVEKKLRSLANHNFSLQDNLTTTESDLQIALTERNQALFESNQLRRNLKGVESRLATIQDAEEQAVQRMAGRTDHYIETMEKVIETTGIDTDELLLAELSSARGDVVKAQGGPFIAAKPDGKLAGQLKADLANLENRIDRWETLQSVMGKLPMAAPMDYFHITSTYGKRRDPINKKWASHYGLDLGGTFKATVRAPSAGVVKHAGWKGKYGKLVEIDHGAGIVTRYGHLHKVLVKKGQKVDFRDKIGLLGSTGRSTGAHLHYEVDFKGKTVNPLKFIKAGRYVFKK